MRRWLPDETMTADEVWKLPERVHHFFSRRAANFIAQEQICVLRAILNANQRSSSYLQDVILLKRPRFWTV
jgi:hypothetical protein